MKIKVGDYVKLKQYPKDGFEQLEDQILKIKKISRCDLKTRFNLWCVRIV